MVSRGCLIVFIRLIDWFDAGLSCPERVITRCPAGVTERARGALCVKGGARKRDRVLAKDPLGRESVARRERRVLLLYPRTNSGKIPYKIQCTFVCLYYSIQYSPPSYDGELDQ